MQGRVLLVGHDLDLLKNDFPSNQLPIDFGGSVDNKNAINITKDIKKAAPQLEKDFAYLKQLCNQSGSYTVLEDDTLSADMEKLRLEIEEKSKERDEAFATEL